MRQRAVLFGTLASLARQGGAELGSGAEELYSRIGLETNGTDRSSGVPLRSGAWPSMSLERAGMWDDLASGEDPAEQGSGEAGSGEALWPKSRPAPAAMESMHHTSDSSTAQPATPEKPQCTATAGLIHCWKSGCVAYCFSEISGALLMLFIAGMSAHTFGNLLAGFGFPAITIFLFFGIVLGPYGTNVVGKDDSRKLTWFNDVALGFIGLSAGGKLNLNDVRENIGTAMRLLLSLVLVTYVGSISATLLFGPTFLPFLREVDFPQRLSAALLIACLAVARSPSSAIALIEELNAHGPFTTTILTVTVLIDVVVVMLFAMTQLFVSLLMSEGGSGSHESGAELLSHFLQQTITSVILGVLIGFALPWIYSCEMPADRSNRVGRSGSAVVILAVLYGGVSTLVVLLQRLVFLASSWALFLDEKYEEESSGWSIQNPLICCMVAGFITCNFTSAGHAFHTSVHDLSGPIYLLFFTFTGMNLDMGVLWRNRSACVLLFGSRTLCIVAASKLGGHLSRQPPEYTDRYWMTLLTQAGVTLGLAQAVAPHFAWGPDFSACIVALVVCNQVVGPPLFKMAIKLVQEDNEGYDPKQAGGPRFRNLGNVRQLGRPKPRGALCIISKGEQVGEAVTHRLRELKWEVLVADESFAVTTNAAESKLLERRSRQHIIALPDKLQREMLARGGAAGIALKPWEKLVPHRSLPTMPKIASEGLLSNAIGKPPTSVSIDLGGESLASLVESLPSGVGPCLRLPPAMSASSESSVAEGVATPAAGPSVSTALEGLQTPANEPSQPPPATTQPPSRPQLPDYSRASKAGARRYASMGTNKFPASSFGGNLASELGETVRQQDAQIYAQTMRLLWLAAGMKNLDVIIVILKTDREVLDVCRMISEMMPMIEQSRKRTWSDPPQLVVSLQDENLLNLLPNTPKPLVIGPAMAVPRLICEVLHPTAHYTGTFESSPLDNPDAMSDVSDETGRSREHRSINSSLRSSINSSPRRRGASPSTSKSSTADATGAEAAPTESPVPSHIGTWTEGLMRRAKVGLAPPPISTNRTLSEGEQEGGLDGGLPTSEALPKANTPAGSALTPRAEIGAAGGGSETPSTGGACTPRAVACSPREVPAALVRARSARREGPDSPSRSGSRFEMELL